MALNILVPDFGRWRFTGTQCGICNTRALGHPIAVVRPFGGEQMLGHHTRIATTLGGCALTLAAHQGNHQATNLALHLVRPFAEHMTKVCRLSATDSGHTEFTSVYAKYRIAE